MQIPLSSPDLNADDRNAVLEVLNSTALSLGPRVPEFEAAICDVTGAKYAVAVNSGTSGLHLAVKAAGIHDGDEVITTAFSFVASANCILFERGIPVFVDIEERSLNIDVTQVERVITPRTKAILLVHVFGRPCPMDKLLPLAKRHGLIVIEDACEALGATFYGTAVGRFGQTGVFAFYPNKQITTGEGGVVITDDGSVASLCRSWRNQGRSEKAEWLEHERLGFNYRLSDINCALGVSQLHRLSAVLRARARVARLYDEALSDIKDVIRPQLTEPHGEVSWFVYVVRLSSEFARKERDEILAGLTRRGIGCRNYFSPIHLQPFYSRTFGFQRGALPVTERVAERTIALPFYTSLSETQVAQVCAALRGAIEEVKGARRGAVRILAAVGNG